MHTLKEIVTGNMANLSYICSGIAYYNISVGDVIYQVGINTSTDENKTTYWQPSYKAITLMRWIRKAIENNELIQIK